MCNWAPGDIAICINVGPVDGPRQGNFPPLVLYKEYLVQDIRPCDCGNLDLNVGIPLIGITGVVCSCGFYSSPETNTWWCSSKRFVKRDVLNVVEEKLDFKQKEIAI